MKQINLLCFDGFTVLDALGPAEVFGRLPDRFALDYFSVSGGEVAGSANVRINTRPVAEIVRHDILLIPGGFGTRALVDDPAFLATLKALAEKSETVLCVCTGSALAARAGLLDGVTATSNKIAWDWVIRQGPNVHWKRRARWVADGKFHTSSGISAGIDMALAFLAKCFGENTALKVADSLEYLWNRDPEQDPFA